MKVFISWSGSPSKEVAELLSENLPSIINVVEPFMSQRDIESGEQWSRRISAELDETSFGIFCLTRDNINAPWLHFEAGAVSKLGGRVAGLLIGDLSPTDINNPLTQFQHRYFNEGDFEKLILDINRTTNFRDEIIRRSLRAQWQELEQHYRNILKVKSTAPVAKQRSTDDLIEEVLLRVRNVEKEVANIRKSPRRSSEEAKAPWSKTVGSLVLPSFSYTIRVNYLHMSSKDAEAFAAEAVSLLESPKAKVVEHSINHYQASGFFTITCKTSNDDRTISEVGESLRKKLESLAHAYFGEADYHVEILPV